MPAEVKPLGILAGQGNLPLRLVQHCLTHNIPVYVVQFQGCDYTHWPAEIMNACMILKTPIEKVGRIFNFFKSHKVDNIVMIGGLQKPDLWALRPDWQGMKTLWQVGVNYLKGDDNFLRSLRAVLEREGFSVRGLDDYLTDLTVQAGSLVGQVSPDYQAAIAEALRFAATDQGQSVLWHPADNSYSYETRAGTGALIDREGHAGSILIKLMKPHQDPDLDRPVIGVDTIKALKAKGCAGLIIQADAVYVIDRAAVIKAASEAGIFIEAVEISQRCHSSESWDLKPLSQEIPAFAGMTPPCKNIYLIAGEESGDVLGGRLITALKDKGDVQIHGIGGQAMQSQGLSSLFPMEDLSVMGLFEILPRLPLLIKRINQTAEDVITTQPAVVVTIDSPDFCKRVVKKARKHCPNTRFIHYVAPTVWAWREGRAKTMAELFDGLICLFPFEPVYFTTYGLEARFCGHPIIETFGEVKETTRDISTILILPGSRKGEVTRMAPIFAKVLQKMQQDQPDLKAVIPALPHVKPIIEKAFEGIEVTYINPEDRFDWFQKAGSALATSGTAGLELAVAGCPHVVAYTMNPLTYWIIKHLVKVRYAHLVNIMEGHEIIPECLQDHCTPDRIIHALQNIGQQDLSHIRDRLAGLAGDKKPSVQAADFITQRICCNAASTI